MKLFLFREILLNFCNSNLVTLTILWLSGLKQRSTNACLPFSTTLVTPKIKNITIHFLVDLVCDLHWGHFLWPVTKDAAYCCCC